MTVTRPTLERRKTLGHLRSINPNMINNYNYTNQSQTCQLLQIEKKKKNFQTLKSGAINLRLNWYRKSILIFERVVCRVLGITFKRSLLLYRSISKYNGWAIIEELSIRRRPRTFLISWGQKTCVKYCYFGFVSWYGFWFAMICIDMNVILDFSNTIQQF